jgi:hypothetical protein
VTQANLPPGKPGRFMQGASLALTKQTALTVRIPPMGYPFEKAVA